MTQPIRVILNTREPGFRAKTYLAYVALFTLLAGDAVRYSVGWWGWGAVLVTLFGFTLYYFFTGEPKRILKQIPWPLIALLVLMPISIIYSNYQMFSAIASFAQFATSLFALFLAAAFSWRHLLRIFSNVVRVILAASLLFEFVAAAMVRGPIAPIFKNYEGDTPPASAYYWTRAHLFDGDRIQGIVGNSNILAFIAMIGLVVFAIDYAVSATPKWLSASSLALAAAMLLLSKSAGVAFAVAAIAVAAIVALIVEGKDRDLRHRIYRWVWACAGVVSIVVLINRAEVFTFFGKTPDMTGRSTIWKLVLGLIAERPIQGWGWISHWMPGVKPFEGLVVINKVPYYQAHNAYLDMWLQLGAIGLLLLLILVAMTFVKLWRLGVRHTNPLYLWPMLVFFGLLAQNLTESRMLLEIGWVLLVLMAVKANDPEDSLEPRGKTPKRARLLGRGLRRNQSQP
ncbi:MAG: O-antigen ligase family protein, partial [Rhodoluna sp.]